jgi:acetolactate synthase-1/2/3 large subunit
MINYNKTLKNSTETTGAYVLLDNLVQNGVEYIFGYPGGAILPIYDELYYWEKANLIKHILVRHEQSAAHAADAYSRVTNKVGVCFATSGPGATNLVTGIANARMDSIPLIVITGQVGRTFIGTDAFQETDIFGITLPIVKHSYTIKDAQLLPEILAEAFFLCQNGRPGPILIDIPKDVGLEKIQNYRYLKYKEFKSKPNYRMEYFTKAHVFERYTNSLKNAFKPLFYVGGGIVRANAFRILHQFAKLFQIPVTTTLMGKSSYNEDDHLGLGLLGMHGTAYANFAVGECDLLVALGARFDDRVTGKLDQFAFNAEVMHIDIDPAEISKNRLPQLAIIGDARKILLEILIEYRKNIKKKDEKKPQENWLEKIYRWKNFYPLITSNYKYQKLSPQETIAYIGKTNPDSFFTTDVGQHQMWAAQLINCQPKKWASSSGLGTMGFGLPAAIGVKIANPNYNVICITGDSSFQMNLQELGTISQYQLGIKIIIINNGWQGMVRQWQQSFYGNRFSNSYMKNGMPDFCQLAKAYNLLGFAVKNLQELESLNFLLNSKDAMIIDVNVTENENCYPMVEPGQSTSKMLGIPAFEN